MDGYQKKKYVSKLIFIFLLGNDIDFGHQEAVNLLSSVHFSEKQIVSLGAGAGTGAGREGDHEPGLGQTNYSGTSVYGRPCMRPTILSLLEISVLIFAKSISMELKQESSPSRRVLYQRFN